MSIPSYIAPLWVAAIVGACLACTATGSDQLCEEEVEVPRVQLLQHALSVHRGGQFTEWVGKNGNVIRSGATTALPPEDISTPAWTWVAPNNTLVRSSPVLDSKGAVYVSTSAGKFVKFSRQGQQLWTRTFMHYVFANPVSYGHIYTLRDDCTFIALDADTGETLWKQRAGYGSGPDTLTVIAGLGTVVSACYGKGEGTPFGGGTSVVAVNATDGTFLWSYRPDTFLYNWIGSIQNNSVLFADASGGVYRLNLADGSLLWKVPPPRYAGNTTGGLGGGPDGVVYVTSNREQVRNFVSGVVSAYSVSDGSLLWQTNTTYAANAGPAASTKGGRQFVAVATGPNPAMAVPFGAVDLEPLNNTRDLKKPGQLLVLDGMTGATVWEYDFPDWYGVAANDSVSHSCLPDSFANPAIDGDGNIYVVGESGRLYRFKDGDKDFEISVHDTGNGFQGAPAISDGILAIAPCNGLQVFLS